MINMVKHNVKTMVDGESFEVHHFLYSQNYKSIKNSFSVHKLDAQGMSYYHISKTYSNVPVTFKKNKVGGTQGAICVLLVH